MEGETKAKATAELEFIDVEAGAGGALGASVATGTSSASVGGARSKKEDAEALYVDSVDSTFLSISRLTWLDPL
jgi:hypothetical protein